MREMDFGTYKQYSFWGNVEYPTNKDAMLARNKLASELRKQGFKVNKYTVTGQMRPYSGLGQPDGTVGNVYKLDVYPKDTIPLKI